MRSTSRMFILVLGVLTTVSIQYCIFHADTTGSGHPSIRNFSDPDDIAPSNYTMPAELLGVCPDFEKAPRCCDLGTMQVLQNKLKQIDGVFGDSGVGCSICAANLKRFWCMYNCAADQDRFIDSKTAAVIDYQVDPYDPTSKTTVATSKINLDIATACGLYESCRSVDFTKALASMKSYQGLFNTLSSQAIPDGVLMNFTYSAEVNNSLAVGINNCSMIFNGPLDQYNYSLGPQGWCNCQHCAYNCTSKIDFSQYITQHGLLGGLQVSVVGRAAIVSGILLVVGLMLRLFTFGKKDGFSEEEGLDRSQSVQSGSYAANN